MSLVGLLEMMNHKYGETERMVGKTQNCSVGDHTSHARFRAVAQSSNDAIIIANTKGKILYWNTAAQVMFGYPEGKVLGKPLTMLIPSRYHAAHTEGLLRVARTKETHLVGKTVEFSAVREDGREFPIELTLSTWTEEGHSLFSGIIRDVSKRKKAEVALRESEEKYRDMFNHAVEGMFQTTPEGRFLSANPALATLLGYHDPEQLMTTIQDVGEQLYVDSERRREFRCRLESDHLVTNFESQVVRKDQSLIWISESARVVLDRTGHPYCYEGFVVDISARKQADELLEAKNRLEAENWYLQEEVKEACAFGDLVGQSPALENVIRQIDLVAATEATVLILGESGTGKELIAREIHSRSRRKARPLIRVNCASIPKELYESEFFGHVKGAFTGAVKDRAGRFEAADDGTLFLDEVGDIPLDLQSKFLRVLQEQQYERVGEERTRKVDVRVVAATNRDLKKEVELGRFRQDLYYRLNVFPIEISPLRDRKEDIPLLADHFLTVGSTKLHRPKPRFTKKHASILQGYDWPGNVRELQNILERALITAQSGELVVELPMKSRGRQFSSMATRSKSSGSGEILSEAHVQELIRQNTLAALKQTRWKIYGVGGAAELLAMKPTTLFARVKKMGLDKQHVLPE